MAGVGGLVWRPGVPSAKLIHTGGIHFQTPRVGNTLGFAPLSSGHHRVAERPCTVRTMRLNHPTGDTVGAQLNPSGIRVKGDHERLA